ncbi:MAG: nucleotide-diphospho-sugar transferase [Bacteroidales bacterium]|jgi:hypothetical protein|nr:nucleotide-diphospho-sugar transferase [Bacteroidales bacterium]
MAQFTTPILFIIFCRLETTKQVFSIIRQIRPTRFFIAADGPRSTVVNEVEKCQAVRQYVLDNIDWDCEVHSLFRKKNLGCGKAVSEAITWFFENVEQGIIIEDDILLSLSFFSYCEELLEKYKNNLNIFHISANNFFGNIQRNKCSYSFVRIPGVWGWASWRRAWSRYDFNIQDLDKLNISIKKIFSRKCDRKYWSIIFEKVQKKEIDTWDYQWVYTIFKNNGLVINPTFNMSTNIGFNAESTHTNDENSIYSNQSRYEITTIKHPSRIKANYILISRINKLFSLSFFDKLLIKLTRLLIKIIRVLRFNN